MDEIYEDNRLSTPPNEDGIATFLACKHKELEKVSEIKRPCKFIRIIKAGMKRVNE